NTPVYAITSSGLQKAYTHWFTEIIPRLAAYEILKESISSEIKLLLDENITDYQLEMLSVLGFEDSDYIFQGADKIIELGEVYIPSAVGLYKFHEECLGIYDKMVAGFDISKVNPNYIGLGDKIFLRRKKLAFRRSLINIDELADIAESNGFFSIAPEEMNLHDKIYVFSKATYLIGEAGGGMSNIFFSNSNRVFILASDAFSSPIFTNISALRDIRISYLFGCSLQATSKKHDNNSNFVISQQSFKKSLLKFLSE
ncbi:glycosyltransferase family 61 protein, partial [Halomonas sp. 86]|uniref:glycosyltransferase family 61 protein n=1 Tax=unclassified Halomonas TaxID=2609666 RepID=UPI0040340C80